MPASTAFDWSTEPTESVETRIRRDRWGRYLIPHPDTGKPQAWTRATTLAGTLADRYGLEQWAKRNVVLGIGARHDLYTLAASCTPDDRDELNRIVRQAEDAAKGQAGANSGTAMHRLTERLDRGQPVDTTDPHLAGDLNAYRTTMDTAGIRVARTADGSAWIERVLVVPEIDVAGTCDRVCLHDHWPLPRIADLKTAKDVLRYGMVEIALQLAIYAHATHWYDPATNQLHPMPAIDQERALVMHLPVGQATCQLYDVDIAAGWQAVQLAVAVRDWRKRKDLAVITTPAAPIDPPADPARVDELRQRVQAIVDAGLANDLAAIWVGVPTLRQGGLTTQHATAAEGFCTTIEQRHQLPFPRIDPPATPPVEPAPTITAQEPVVDWAQRGRDLLDQLGDDTQARAIAAVAGCTDVRIGEPQYRRLEAVFNEIAHPQGALHLIAGADGWTVQAAVDARTRLTGLHGDTAAVLATAKNAAKFLGIAAPRSLVNVTSNPLLTALTAAGAAPSNDEKEMKP